MVRNIPYLAKDINLQGHGNSANSKQDNCKEIHKLLKTRGGGIESTQRKMTQPVQGEQ